VNLLLRRASGTALARLLVALLVATTAFCGGSQGGKSVSGATGPAVTPPASGIPTG